MLNRHPEIAVPPETKLFVDFDRAGVATRRDCLRRIEMDYGVEFDDLEAMARSFSVAELLVELRTKYVRRANRLSIRVFGEKTPEHTSRIHRIRELFPRAPIIAMVRDGVTVADSLTRVPWLRCNHGAGAVIWNYYMGFITQAVDQGLPGLYVVRYEELAESPEPILSDLFRVLGVAGGHESECVRPNPEVDAGLFPPRETAWKQRAREAVQRPTKAVLPISLHRTVEAISGPMMRRWGYPSNVALSASQRLRGRVRGWCSSLRTVACLPMSTVWREAKPMPRQWVDRVRASRTARGHQPFVGANSQQAVPGPPHFQPEYSMPHFSQRPSLCPPASQTSSLDE